MPHDYRRLAAAIRGELDARGWTQHDLARETGKGLTTVGGLVRGRPQRGSDTTYSDHTKARVEDALGWKRGSFDNLLARKEPTPVDDPIRDELLRIYDRLPVEKRRRAVIVLTQLL